MATVEAIASRSKLAGRHGIKTKSASCAARAAAVSEWGGEFKQTTDLFHRILIDDKAQTSSALPCAIAVGALFDEYRKFQLI